MQHSNGYLIGLLLGSLIVGILCGLAPLITGITRKNLKLGIIGFIACLVSSFFLGIILALPVAVVFVFLLLRKKADKDFTPPPNPPNFNN